MRIYILYLSPRNSLSKGTLTLRMRYWQSGGPGLLQQAMGHQTMSPHIIVRDQIACSLKDLPSDPSRTRAEAEFAAFSASSKPATDVKVKLPLLGKGLWPFRR